ncbi:hypothetical protein H4S04_008601, partial [Coemansia sp. S16]
YSQADSARGQGNTLAASRSRPGSAWCKIDGLLQAVQRPDKGLDPRYANSRSDLYQARSHLHIRRKVATDVVAAQAGRRRGKGRCSARQGNRWHCISEAHICHWPDQGHGSGDEPHRSEEHLQEHHCLSKVGRHQGSSL